VANRLLPTQRSAEIAEGLQVGVSYAISSHFIDEIGGPETLFLDGETHDATLNLRYGFAERWDLALTLPYRSHRDGFLDGVINDWHDVFGLPDGGRSHFPNGELAYRYQGPAGDFSMSSPEAGLADPQLALQFALWRGDEGWLSLAAGVEWEGGDPAGLTGSGGEEVFAALRFSGRHQGNLPLTWHGQVGYSRADDVAPLGALAERDLWFAGLTADWRIGPAWSLVAQLDAHSAPFDSELAALSDASAMLSLAARWRLNPRWVIDAGFSEDVAVETAPDVVFFTRLRYSP